MVGFSDPLESTDADLQPLVEDAVLAATVPGSLLFSAVRNEAPFIVEWIAYHKAIGFERVVIYSNKSDDGTDELLSALASSGEIEHVMHEVPEGIGPQQNAARLANESGLLKGMDWVLWLDADEFLVVNAGQGALEDLTNSVGAARGILVPWRIFGDGGNRRFPGRFVSDKFTLASRVHLCMLAPNPSPRAPPQPRTR